MADKEENLARRLRPNPYAGDDGSLLPALAAAFQVEENRSAEIVAALGRVLLAVVPSVDAEMEMEMGNLFQADFPGGEKAVAVFSSFSALQKVCPAARPLPIDIKSIAKTALTRGAGILVLDPYLATQTYLGRSAVLALTTGIMWQPAWEDKEFRVRLEEDLRNCLLEQAPELEKLWRGITLVEGKSGSCAILLHIDAQARRSSAEQIANCGAKVLSLPAYLDVRLEPVEIIPTCV